jgi:alkanesulfonate monooxygenase SsuD/methylene tetrahydromethanopterin reductase-like flavin-dependent oxidoreductase (luciferase family)
VANLLEEIELADQVGLDVFGVGEHHRRDYAVSALAVVLGAAAARTANIRLTSAVTVLSSEDPVRVFQQYATVDLLSHGRAEIMAGRGSFTESFPLFGLRPRRLRRAVRREARSVAAAARVGAAPSGAGGPAGPPAPGQEPLPVWMAVGGNPPSVVRAGALGLPMALAIIGGEPARFAPLAKLHHWAAEQYGHGPLPVSINSRGFVADTSQAAADSFFATYAEVMTQLGRERGWPP